MDLLGDYGSDNDTSDDNEVNQGASSGGSKITGKRKRSEQPNDSTNASDCKAQRIVTIVPSKQVPSNTFVRTTPHVKGNWSGHVFGSISIKEEEDVDEEWKQLLTESIHRFKNHLKRIGFAKQQSQQDHVIISSHLDCEELHLSLSRPFTLQLGNIESFLQQLEKRLCHLPTVTLRIQLSSNNNSNQHETILVNDEGTRSFWTLPVMDTSPPALMAIVEEVDAVLRSYNQPTYYNPPLFHVSIASVLGNVQAVARTAPTATTKPSKLDGTTTTTCTTSSRAMTRHVKLKQVQCSFGNTKYYSIKLREL